jgi:catechol 2,3-dioxygenase-like lactoylglutathione lyase family enzyme
MIAGRLASGVAWAAFSSDSTLVICAWIGGLRFLSPSTTRASRVSASPETIDHMSFHLPDMATLRKALAHLKAVGVEIEDPGDEIGPEAVGSKNRGLWFHDADGYRWELSVLGGK